MTSSWSIRPQPSHIYEAICKVPSFLSPTVSREVEADGMCRLYIRGFSPPSSFCLAAEKTKLLFLLRRRRREREAGWGKGNE